MESLIGSTSGRMDSLAKVLKEHLWITIGSVAVVTAGSTWYFVTNKEQKQETWKTIKSLDIPSHIRIPTPLVTITLNGISVVLYQRNVVNKTLYFVTAINVITLLHFWYKYSYKNKKASNSKRNKTYPHYDSTTKTSQTVANPLVLLIGISKYKEIDAKTKKIIDLKERYGIECELEGVEKDIANLLKLFKTDYEYKHVYTIQDYINTQYNNEEKCDEWMATDDAIVSFCEYYGDSTRVSEMKVDGLIVCYSGHGNENDFLFCSNCKLLSLFTIKNFFHEVKCKSLKGKPKLFYPDCCRQEIFFKFGESERNTKVRGKVAARFHSKDYESHDPTNIYTFNPTSNLEGTTEDTTEGGYMTTMFVEYLKNNINKQQAQVSILDLAQHIKSSLREQDKPQVAEERSSLLVPNVYIQPNTRISVNVDADENHN